MKARAKSMHFLPNSIARGLDAVWHMSLIAVVFWQLNLAGGTSCFISGCVKGNAIGSIVRGKYIFQIRMATKNLLQDWSYVETGRRP